MNFKFSILALVFLVTSPALASKVFVSTSSLKASAVPSMASTATISPDRYTTGQYVLYKYVDVQNANGSVTHTESIVCQGSTSVPVTDTGSAGGDIDAVLSSCETTTNAQVVTANLLSLVMYSMKPAVFPGEAPSRVRDNFVMLTLSSDPTSSLGLPYGLSFVSSRQEMVSSLNDVYAQGDGCGAAPLPACGGQTAESFVVRFEFGQ